MRACRHCIPISKPTLDPRRTTHGRSRRTPCEVWGSRWGSSVTSAGSSGMPGRGSSWRAISANNRLIEGGGHGGHRGYPGGDQGRPSGLRGLARFLREWGKLYLQRYNFRRRRGGRNCGLRIAGCRGWSRECFVVCSMLRAVWGSCGKFCLLAGGVRGRGGWCCVTANTEGKNRGGR